MNACCQSLIETELLDHLIALELEHLGDALLLHCYAVKDIRLLHRAASVGDEDELGAARHIADIAGVSGDVDIVERRLNLVEYAERSGIDFENGEEQSDCRKSLFTAREKVDILDILARRLNLDIDVAFENILRIVEHKLRLAAREQISERFAEGVVDIAADKIDERQGVTVELKKRGLAR